MRPRFTELDYAIVAVAPALIMVLVGSLVLFLVGIFYDGQFPWRLNFIMCMFVLGIVANARVGIEVSAIQATVLGGILGVLVLFSVMRFVPGGVVLATVLLGVVWWLSTRLVYDCTVSEEEGETVVGVKMTLTAPGCGMGPVIAADAQSKIMTIEGVDDAKVELVWEPAWNQDMISEEGKMKLGMI